MASRSPPAAASRDSAASVRDLLTCERIVLNLLGRLMGVATLTQRVRRSHRRHAMPRLRHAQDDARLAAAGKIRRALRRRAQPSHRAVRRHPDQGQPPRPACGPSTGRPRPRRSPCGRLAQFLRAHAGERSLADLIVEVEVDSLDQLAAVLPERPDIVLLGQHDVDQLRRGGRAARRAGAAGRARGIRRRDTGNAAGDRGDGRRPGQRRGADPFGACTGRGARLFVRITPPVENAAAVKRALGGGFRPVSTPGLTARTSDLGFD